MGPSPDNYAAAWSLVFDGSGSEGKQPARVPSMTGLGRAHSEPVSSGVSPPSPVSAWPVALLR